MINNNKSAREIDSDLHLSNFSAYNLINEVTLTDRSDISLKKLLPKSSRKKSRLTEQQVLLANVVQEDPSLTQKGMRTYLESKNVLRSQGMVSRYLKELGITRKKSESSAKKKEFKRSN
ncbi:hypothetical protein CDIK_1990 [Cucumispora dikerogammari]|nr:hypothetical protein CDIK_1990 [Cucumispora dikerogammari]